MEDNKDFIHEHPLMTAGAALTVGLLAPVGWGMLMQNDNADTEDGDQATPGKANGATMNLDFIHENPLMVTTAALTIGLLIPLGLGMLAQAGATDTEDGDKKSSGKANGKGENQNFIQEHPLMTTGVALAIGLLAPIGLGLLMQTDDTDTEDEDQATPGKDDAKGTDQGFMQEHPLMATAAALSIGLLAPLGLGILMQTGASDAEDGDEATPGKTNGGAASQNFIREHPLMATTAALTIGLLAPLGLGMLTQTGTADTADGDQATPGKADGKETNQNFIHQHPLIATAAALTVGLLIPLGLGMLAQAGAADAEEGDETTPEKANGKETSQDFMHEHPLMATGVALAIGLLAPIGLGMLAQLGAADAEDGDQATPDKASGAATNLDFMNENPLLVTAATLTLGLLIPLGLGMLAQICAADAEDGDQATPGKINGKGTILDFINENPLMATGVALTIGLLAPLGLGMLVQTCAADAADEDKTTPGKADGKGTDQDFIHQHPLIATATALTIGLLAPLGLGMLAQTGAVDAADGDEATPGENTGAATNLDFMHENPLMVTAAALTIGLLIPLGLGLLAQTTAELAEDTESKNTRRRKATSGGATSQDFIHQHPLISTAAALTIGLLAPLVPDMLTKAGEQSQRPQTGEKTATDETQPGKKSIDNAIGQYLFLEHPLMTTAAITMVATLSAALLTGPVSRNLAASGNTDKHGEPGRADTDASTRSFTDQHPYMTTAGALGMGLLMGPVALQWLAQISTEKPSQPDHGDTDISDQDFAHQHPFLTTAAALGAGLLTGPVARILLTQLESGPAETEKGGAETMKHKVPTDKTAVPEPADVSGQDLIYQHPFLTTAAALGVGLLLGPLGIKLLEQSSNKKAEEAASTGAEDDMTTTGRSQPGQPGHDQADASTRQHPFVTTVAALGGELLAGPGGLSFLRQRGAQSGTAPLKEVWFEPAYMNSPRHGALLRSASGRRAYDTGALDMEFKTHRPDGKDVEFNFEWKKRPVETPDADWPTDNMGFKADRPDGKQTAFRMTRKTRPVPAGYGDTSPEGIRPGLGEAKMNFVSRRPDRGEFRFSWEKVPPDPALADSQQLTRDADDSDEPMVEPADEIALEAREQLLVGQDSPGNEVMKKEPAEATADEPQERRPANQDALKNEANEKPAEASADEAPEQSPAGKGSPKALSR